MDNSNIKNSTKKQYFNEAKSEVLSDNSVNQVATESGRCMSASRRLVRKPSQTRRPLRKPFSLTSSYNQTTRVKKLIRRNTLLDSISFRQRQSLAEQQAKKLTQKIMQEQNKRRKMQQQRKELDKVRRIKLNSERSNQQTQNRFKIQTIKLINGKNIQDKKIKQLAQTKKIQYKAIYSSRKKEQQTIKNNQYLPRTFDRISSQTLKKKDQKKTYQIQKITQQKKPQIQKTKEEQKQKYITILTNNKIQSQLKTKSEFEQKQQVDIQNFCNLIIPQRQSFTVRVKTQQSQEIKKYVFDVDPLTDSKKWSANIFMKTDINDKDGNLIMVQKNSLFNMKNKIIVGVLILFIIIFMANMLITPTKLTKKKRKLKQ